MKFKKSLMLFATAAVLVSSAPGQIPWTAQRMDSLEATDEAVAYGVNNRHEAIGDWKFMDGANEKRRGFRWDHKNDMHLLGTFGTAASGYRWTMANAINNQSPAMIVGKSRNDSGNYKAFWTFYNDQQNLRPMTGDAFRRESEAKGVNTSTGYIVGWGDFFKLQNGSWVDTGFYRPFVYQNGGFQMTHLGYFSGVTTGDGAANDINEANVVVGWADDAAGNQRAFYDDSPRSAGIFKIPLPAGFTESIAAAVNNANPPQVVGRMRVNRQSPWKGFIWQPGAPTATEIHNAFGGDLVEAYDINDYGVIVGNASHQGHGGAYVGFIHQGGVMYDANLLKDAGPGGYGNRITALYSISNGYYGDTTLHAAVGYGSTLSGAKEAVILRVANGFGRFQATGQRPPDKVIGSVTMLNGGSEVTVAPGGGVDVQLNLTYNGVPDKLATSRTATFKTSHPGVYFSHPTMLVPRTYSGHGPVAIATDWQAVGQTIAITAKVDGYYEFPFTLKVRPWHSSVQPSSASGRIRQTVTVSAKLTREDNHVGAGRRVQFFSDGTYLGEVDTGSDGTATVDVKIPESTAIGNRTLEARYIGISPTEQGASATSTLSVSKATTSVSAEPVYCWSGDVVYLVAKVINTDDKGPSAGHAVTFKWNGREVHTVTSDSAGDARLQFTVPNVPAGVYPMEVVVADTGSAIGSTTTLECKVQPALTSFTVSPSQVMAGQSTTGKVLLNGNAAGADVNVQLADNSSFLNTPSFVRVPINESTAEFSIGTVQLSTTATRQVIATLHSVTRTANVTIMATPFLASLRVPAQVVAGSTFELYVDLTNPALPGGTVVQLADDTGSISTPASMTVPAGSKTGSILVDTQRVSVAATRSITATLNGTKKLVRITLLPLQLSSLSLSPSTVKGGNSTTGTVSLNYSVGGSNAVVTLTDNSGSITTPSSLTIPVGQQTGTFGATTSRVGATATRQVTASFGGITRTANLTLTP